MSREGEGGRGKVREGEGGREREGGREEGKEGGREGGREREREREGEGGRGRGRERERSKSVGIINTHTHHSPSKNSPQNANEPFGGIKTNNSHTMKLLQTQLQIKEKDIMYLARKLNNIVEQCRTLRGQSLNNLHVTLILLLILLKMKMIPQ